MKTNKLNYLFYLLVLLSFSCSKNNNEEHSNKLSADEIRCLLIMGKVNKIPLDQAKENAISYINSFDINKTRSSDRNIKCVDVITSEKEAKSKSNSLLDTIMYVINFSDNKGYILLSSDNRTSNIFGFSTEGNFDVNNLDTRNKIILEGIELTFYNQINESKILTDSLSKTILKKLDKLNIDHINTKSSTRNIEAISGSWIFHQETISPLIKTLWNQGDPYNRDCPLIDEIKTPVGCVAISLGQVLTFHKKSPSGYNWDLISKNYGKEDISEGTYEIAKFLRAIGNSVDMEYGKTGSSANHIKVTKYLKEIGFKYDHISGYNYNRISNSIKDRRPVIIGGSRIKSNNEKVGHSWILDGFCLQKRTTIFYYYGVEIDKTTEYVEFMNNNTGNGWSEYLIPGIFDYPIGLDFILDIRPK